MNSVKQKQYRQSIFFGMAVCDWCGAEKNKPCCNDDDEPMLRPCNESVTRKTLLRIHQYHYGTRIHFCIKKRVNGRDLKFFESTNKESANKELEKINELVKKHGYELAFEIYRESRKHVTTKNTSQGD